MTRELRAFVVCILWAFLAVPAAPATASQPPGREILVMLRLPAAHFRPHSGYGGDYDDPITRTANRRVAQRVARRQGVELVDGWPMPLLGVDCYVVRLRDGQDAAAIVAALGRDPEVSWAQPMQLYEAQAAPRGDPLYPVQPAARWRLAELHRLATGRGVRIAVIDSQVETRHPDLAGQVLEARNFVANQPALPEAHGTGIAGVIAARADNGLGIAGIAPGARLLALRACWQRAGTTLCDTLSLAKALQFAIGERAQVINLSLSGPPDRLLDSLLDVAMARRISIVAAYDPARPGGGFPASKPGVVAVADAGLKLDRRTIYGAPGTDVPTTQPNGRWYVVSGNSYAAAHVSGLLALARETRPAADVRLATAGSGNEIDACSTLVPASGSHDRPCTVGQVAARAAR